MDKYDDRRILKPGIAGGMKTSVAGDYTSVGVNQK
jgi:hypothetical protein